MESKNQRLARLFGALSDPTRLRIVRILLDEERVCVCELVQRLRLGQSTVSHHMAMLKQAGVVRGMRRGQRIDYWMASPATAKEALELLEAIGCGESRKVSSGAR